MQKLLILWILANFNLVCSKRISEKEKDDSQDIEVSNSNKFNYKYINPIGPYTYDSNEGPIKNKNGYNDIFSSENPLLGALILSSNLHLRSKNLSPNHPTLPPINPFLALLLSQYGRYLPLYGPGRGIYAYQAANDFHNNKPFGPYKIYEDSE